MLDVYFSRVIVDLFKLYTTDGVGAVAYRLFCWMSLLCQCMCVCVLCGLCLAYADECARINNNQTRNKCVIGFCIWFASLAHANLTRSHSTLVALAE